MTDTDFQAQIKQGIPAELPPARPYDNNPGHAPRRKQILTPEEEKLALRNALRYFPKEWHAELAPEFANELREYGRIYMYRSVRNIPCMQGRWSAILHVRDRLRP